MQMPALREQLLQDRDWGGIADRQKFGAFAPGSEHMSVARLSSLAHAFDFITNLKQSGPAAHNLVGLLLGSQ